MNVLLAVDLRSDAAEVVQRALPWIERLGAVVDLVFVDTSRAVLEAYTPPAFQTELTRLLAEEEVKLRELLARLPAAHRGRGIVDLTSVDEMIAARARDYALVIVGTRGRQGLAHLWAGSVAERIVRFCPISVLVLREHTIADPLHLLFAVDLADDPSRLLGALGPLAHRLGATVDVLTVDQPPVIAPTLDAPALYTVLAKYLEDSRAEKMLRLRTLGEAHLEPQHRGRILVDTGSPIEGIVARSKEADLLVLGTHGRVGVAHAMVGSVAERAVRRAETPVLVLRP
jgi:nucleotide-binding universal stress UspA family protein